MTKCRRCNRTLKSEPWATQGIGKICAAKEGFDRDKSNNETGDVIVPYDGGDIFMERLGALTHDNSGQLALMQHSASGIKTNVQRIEVKHSPSGLNFGYGGSGPADMALNILLMFTDKETAHRHYQDFKWKYIAVGNDVERIVIQKQEILSFIAKSISEKEETND